MTRGELVAVNIARWDSLFAARPWSQYPPEELVRFMARAFPDARQREGVRVLEVGCGPGANLWYLVREGFVVSGIDGSAHAIAAARRRLRTESLTDRSMPELRVGNFAVLPWADQTFDAVIDIEAIVHNPMAVIGAVLSEIWRVLKPGGRVFAKMFGPATTGAQSGAKLEPGTSQNPTCGPLKGCGIVHCMTETEIRDGFKRFSRLELDWVHRSDLNRAVEIFEWLVEASK
jgi:SAM-dependent methyltransferase